MADPLAELLVEEGLLSPAQVGRALARQREAGGSLDTAILELRLLGEPRLTEALASAAGLPAAPPEAWSVTDPRARRVFPARVAERHGLAPFALDGRDLLLAAAYPVDMGLLDEVSFMLSLHLRPHVAPEWRVRQLVHHLYGTALAGRLEALAGRAGPEPAPVEARVAPRSPPPPAPEGDPARPDAEPLEPLLAALSQAVEELEVEDLLAEPREAEAAPAPASSEPPRWTLAEARGALDAAASRDEVVAVALRYARDFFEFAALLAVTRRAVTGHDAVSETDPRARARCRRLSFSAQEPGIFRTVVETAGPYLGPAPRDSVSEAAIAALGRDGPRTLLLYPVSLRDRPVCLLYADNGEAPVSPRRLGDLLLLWSGLGAAFERVLRQRKARGERPGPSGEREAWEAREPGRFLAAPAPEEEVEPGEFRVAAAAEVLAAPQAFDARDLVERLARSERGSAERGRLIARLVERGSEAAAALAARLPGPLEVTSPSLAEVTPVWEHGPLLAAAAALGTAVAKHLVPLLGDAHPDRRRYAALVLAHVADPATWPDVASCVFDPDPRVAAAARAALAEARSLPEMRPVVDRLRRELVSAPARAGPAAQALGQLKDVESIPLLIQLLEGAPVEVAAAAGDALSQITLRRFGEDPRAWLAWWKESRGAPRWRWLVDALMDDDRDLRLAAAEELTAVVRPPILYMADGPPSERAEAARAWAEACETAPPAA